jgi:hypothetical protein
MAAEIYACTDTTHATAACVVSSSFIIPNPAVLQQRRRTKEQSGLEKNKATKNKSGSKNQPTKNNRPKQEGGLSLTPTPAAAAKIRDPRSGAGPS